MMNIMESWDELAVDAVVSETSDSLRSKKYDVFVVAGRNEALEKIKNLIPTGATVMNGSSITLEQIGYLDLLKSGKSGWKNLHEQILAEKDPLKQKLLRRQSTISDYYVGSVHALIKNGDFLVASNSASQIPSIAYNSQNLIFVVSTKKIVPDLNKALGRLETYVMPLEDKRMMERHGVGTHLSKILIVKGESPFSDRKITFILVKEKLGF